MNRTCLTAIAAGLIAIACGAAQAAETTRYVLYTGDGSVGGEQVVERADDGLVTVHYRYKDNGRGPELTERLRLAADGTLASYEVRGSTTMGAPVDERYERRGDDASWHSTSEQGSTHVTGTALYVPLISSGEFASISIAALAARPDGQLPLLPSGLLTQRVLDEAEVTGPGGTKRRVQLLAQTGLGIQPSFYWATTGTQPRMFATIAPGWYAAVEQGWEAGLPALTERQKAAEVRLLKDQAARLKQPLPGLSVIRNARIFDSDTAHVGAPSDLYMLRGRITAIVPAGTLQTPVDAEIDAGGRIALPGLFDMHTHFDRWDGVLHLAAGVTTARDMGNDNAKLQQILDEIAAGELIAPRLVTAGLLEGASKDAAHLGIIIKTLPEAKAAVDWYASRGYPQLKIYNSFPRALVPEIVAYAHARGMRVSGHVPAFMRAQEVVEDGFDEIQHINQVLLNFLVTPTTDTRTTERFYLPAEKVASLDFDSAPVQDFIALLQRHQTVIDSTLVTFDFIKQRDGELSEPYAAIAPHLPPDMQRGFRVADMKIPDDATAARYRTSYAKMVEFVGRMYRAGIPLVAGTDALAGFTLQSELELYVKAGIAPAEVLQIATRNGARYTRTSAERGSLVAGKLADVVLVDGDPTVNIADIRKVALVVTQGGVLSPSALYRSIGVAPFVAGEPTLQRRAADAATAPH